MQAFIDEHFRENFIEIYEGEPEPRLVTCIEVLSPSNKRGGKKGWKLYLRKRNALLLGKANLVEIDLVRGGRRMPMVGKWPESPYYLLVARESRGPVLPRLARLFRPAVAGDPRAAGPPRPGHPPRLAADDRGRVRAVALRPPPRL